MKFQFERFTAAGRRFNSSISIRRNGALGLSQGALHQAAITGEGDWHVVLFYDRANGALAIKPTLDGNEEGAIKLSVRAASGSPLSAYVAAKSFFNFYAIPHSETKSYRATWLAAEKMLVAELNSESETLPSSEGETPATMDT